MMRLPLARLSAGLRWSSPRATARLLMAFARAERSSHYDLMAAARLCTDPARKALYLRHASDESRHALMFSLRAQQLDAQVAGDPREQHADFEHLFERLGELRFLAFVQLGEARGRAQLTLYRDELLRLGDGKTRALLDAVLVDEAQHETYTRAQLLQLAGDEAALRRELRHARRWELARAWLRAGRGLTGQLFTWSMRALYLTLWPLSIIERLRAPKRLPR